MAKIIHTKHTHTDGVRGSRAHPGASSNCCGFRPLDCSTTRTMCVINTALFLGTRHMNFRPTYIPVRIGVDCIILILECLIGYQHGDVVTLYIAVPRRRLIAARFNMHVKHLKRHGTIVHLKYGRFSSLPRRAEVEYSVTSPRSLLGPSPPGLKRVIAMVRLSPGS